MIAVVTYFRLRSAIRGFELFWHEHKIKKQLKEMNCMGYKKRTFFKDAYTMTLWKDEKTMVEFARSGAHLESMRSTARLGSQFKSVTFETEGMPTWKEAIARLDKDGRVVNYKDPRQAQRPATGH